MKKTIEESERENENQKFSFWANVGVILLGVGLLFWEYNG